jgi:hypothetical protein
MNLLKKKYLFKKKTKKKKKKKKGGKGWPPGVARGHPFFPFFFILF